MSTNKSQIVGLINIGTSHLLGLRYIEQSVKKAGYQVKTLHLPEQHNKVKDVSTEQIDIILDLFSDCQIVGIQMLTDFLHVGEPLSKALRNVGKYVVWGGSHPTSFPEESLKCCDAVCLGEGEESFCSFLDAYYSKSEYHSILGMWFFKDDAIIRNANAPMVTDIDATPQYEYDFESHYFLDGVDIKVNAGESYISQYGSVLSSMITRGCPLKCTYCINIVYLEMYPKEKTVRSRNIEKVIREIEAAIVKIPCISVVHFHDDDFLSLKPDYLDEFCQKYKERIGIPFSIITIPTLRKKQEYIDKLYKCGMRSIGVGLESGSKRILKEIYQRPALIRQTKEFLEFTNKYDDLSIQMDIIVDNPWERDEDQASTVGALLSFPNNYKVALFSLKFFPGTPLYTRALEEGIDVSEGMGVPYTFVKNNYFTSLIVLFKSMGVSNKYIHILNSKDIYKAWWFTPVYIILDRTATVKYLYYLKIVIDAALLKNKGLFWHYVKTYILSPTNFLRIIRS